MNTTERENVFQTALRQLQAERERASVPALGSIEREPASRCPECQDRDSNPMHDGYGGIVCGICGAEWR